MHNKDKNQPLTNDQIVSLAPAAGALVPHDAVSDRYSFVPTIQAVDLLRSAGWVPVDAEQSRARKSDRDGYQKHRIRFMMTGAPFAEERVDLVLVNSHDRGSAFNLDASIWRKICGNGLMTSTELFHFSHKHINFDGKAFIESAYRIADSAGIIARQVDDLKTIELTPDEKGVYAQAAHGLVYDDPNAAPIAPEKLLKERRYDDKGHDLWTVFNVLQENITKGGINGRKRGSNGRMRSVKTRPVKSIDRDIKLNRALWTLTQGMKRLKNRG